MNLEVDVNVDGEPPTDADRDNQPKKNTPRTETRQSRFKETPGIWLDRPPSTIPDCLALSFDALTLA